MGVGFSEDGPFFRLTADELAGWIEHKGPESWWSVDGEPKLMSSVSFPCTGDDMARAIRQVGKDLFLFSIKDSVDDAASERERRIEEHSFYGEERGEHILGLKWVDAGAGDNWMLLEDKETPRLVKSILEENDPGGEAED